MDAPHDRPSFLGRRRLWIKLLVASLVPVALIVAGIGWLAYRAARVSLEEQLGDSLMTVARQAARLVAKPWALELAPGDEASRSYRNLQTRLAELRAAAKVHSIYLFDRQERALLDSEGGLAIGTTIVKLAADRSELREVFAGGERSSVLFSAKDGRLAKTGFAPVVLEGEVRAAVGVDGSASFFEPLRELGRTLLIVGGVAVLLVILVTLGVSRGITRPLDRLAGAARAIGAGDLGTEIRPETRDEIGLLAHTLNEMRRSIEERDAQLQMMLSGIAHEVRNPLGGMALFAGLLQEELSNDAEALQHVRRITTELDYLSRVVNDFLDFARKRPLQVDRADPRLEMEEIRALCDSALLSSGVSLQVTVAPDIREVRWDRERMRRVLLNLIQNAVQASAQGQAVQVRFTRRGSGLEIQVRDQGTGISADRREMIFKPFFTTRQQGTGLGLALAKKIVEAHGGAIDFDSEPGQGTRFTVRLPQREEPGPDKEAAWPAS